MIKKPLVFSFIYEQRRFLFLLIGFLTFLMTISGGLVLSVSNAVSQFNSNLARSGLIQIPNGGNADPALKIINENKNEITKIRTINKDESAKLLKKWLKNTDALNGYIPTIIEVQAKSTLALDKIANQTEASNLRFVYSRSATPERGVGIKIILLSGFIFATILAALIACVVHSVRNIILIHKKEVEILNQVGGTNNYIAKELQKAMFVQSAKATSTGLVSGWAMLLLINGLSSATKVGLLANMGLGLFDWVLTLIFSIILVILTIFITRKTTLKILAK